MVRGKQEGNHLRNIDDIETFAIYTYTAHVQIKPFVETSATDVAKVGNTRLDELILKCFICTATLTQFAYLNISLSIPFINKFCSSIFLYSFYQSFH